MKLKVPTYAKNQAREGLRLRDQYPESQKPGLDRDEADSLGINSGVERARQLMDSDYVSFEDAVSIASFYQRFRNCHTDRCEVAIKLWGGRKFGKRAVAHVKENINR